MMVININYEIIFAGGRDSAHSGGKNIQSCYYNFYYYPYTPVMRFGMDLE